MNKFAYLIFNFITRVLFISWMDYYLFLHICSYKESLIKICPKYSTAHKYLNKYNLFVIPLFLERGPDGIVAKVLDCGLKVNKFKLQLCSLLDLYSLERYKPPYPFQLWFK